ncbi:hypothetical protein CASFOL_036292 [Castilleja foliolosa]|uniref:Uncharacterized protein n=1 Tax=Castilleja foliolosa TaxID=1961234 RepID=A0ABD3BV78_9LAMI
MPEAVAVEVTGGPTINFVPGRKDSKTSPREGRLPDEDAFFKDYAESHKKNSECPTGAKSIVKDGTILAQGAVGVAVAAAVVILSCTKSEKR